LEFKPETQPRREEEKKEEPQIEFLFFSNQKMKETFSKFSDVIFVNKRFS